MKLYYSPGACSMVVRMVLNHVGKTYTSVRVDLSAGEQHSSWFLAINPKGKVPTLVRDDGTILTELGTILEWIALQHPAAALIPNDDDQAIRVREIVEYCISTIHAFATTRIFMPAAFGAEADHSTIVAEGQLRLGRGLALLEKGFCDGDYFVGKLTIADFMIYWIALGAVIAELDLPPAIRRGFESTGRLPAVQQSLVEEGFA